MIILKDLLSDQNNMMSVDGEHWEPIVPISPWWRCRLYDAIAVLKGEAGAVRNTRRTDITGGKDE